MSAFVRVTLALLALALAVVLALPFVKAAKEHPNLGLLQAENALLRQENRSLAQQLEAERLQSAALTRMLQNPPASVSTPSPEPAPAKPDLDAVLLPPPRITHAQVQARYDRAKALAKSGAYGEALAEYLWCYDVGMPPVAGFGGVRGSFLLGEIARLGESYPVALNALRARRDQLLDALVDDPDDSSAFQDFASLNRALKDDSQNLALFEKLPAGDERRGMLGYPVYQTLAQARRYDEALEAHSFRHMTLLFDSLTEERELPGMSEEKRAQRRERNRPHAIQTAAGNIEVLVGAGKLDQARTLAAKILAYDPSPTTRQALGDAVARAGRPDFVLP